MSRRVCETCAWFVTSRFVVEDGSGICVYNEFITPYAAKHSAMSPLRAAESIRMEDDACKHWEHERRGLL